MAVTIITEPAEVKRPRDPAFVTFTKGEAVVLAEVLEQMVPDSEWASMAHPSTRAALDRAYSKVNHSVGRRPFQGRNEVP